MVATAFLTNSVNPVLMVMTSVFVMMPAVIAVATMTIVVMVAMMTVSVMIILTIHVMPAIIIMTTTTVMPVMAVMMTALMSVMSVMDILVIIGGLQYGIACHSADGQTGDQLGGLVITIFMLGVGSSGCGQPGDHQQAGKGLG